MRIFDILSDQIDSMRLPLFAVSLSAIRRPDTPLFLMLHWHAFHRAGPRRSGEPDAGPHATPSSGLQINTPWQAIQHIESEVLDAAWQLGAWSLERNERRACNTIGAPLSEAHACRQAFGDFPEAAGEALVAEAPDRESMMHLAADVGYVSWQFRPVAGGIWDAREGDDTLALGGRRAPPCPHAPMPSKAGKDAHTSYRLGKIERLIY